MLVENTLFGVEDKVEDATNLLREHEPPEGYYLCFSGGKDSVVIHELAKLAGVKFDAHHNITTVEPPELMRFIRDYYPNVIHEHPALSMAQLIVKHKIPPLRIARYCCNELKEKGGKNRVKITGIRAEESHRRAKRKKIEIDTKGGLFVHVIHNWTVSDIWQFIRQNNLPYCKLYDEGFSRIGCVLCPFESFDKTLLELERFPAIVDYYRRACRKAFNQWREYHSPKNSWKSGDDMFNWWINERKGRHIAEDCNSIPLFSEDDGTVL